MNYIKTYIQICNHYKALDLKQTPHSEICRHHIVPRSCNGSNDESNLVNLPYKAHVIVHHLLAKIYQNTKFESKMKCAYELMIGVKPIRKNRIRKIVDINDRLNDFKKILTYHIVKNIYTSFNSDYKLYYMIADLYCHISKKTDTNYTLQKYVMLFNQIALSRNKVKAIFGKDHNNNVISYTSIIENDPDIKKLNQGTYSIDGKQIQLSNRYILPYNHISAIFENARLLKDVLDIQSSFYTKRQRKLIYNQILKPLLKKSLQEHIDKQSLI